MLVVLVFVLVFVPIPIPVGFSLSFWLGLQLYIYPRCANTSHFSTRRFNFYYLNLSYFSMKPSYLCHCELRPTEHQVLKSEKMVHKLELERIIATRESEVSQLAFRCHFFVDNSFQITSLADLLTTMTLTDEGPNAVEQQSQLEMSHSESQLPTTSLNPSLRDPPISQGIQSGIALHTVSQHFPSPSNNSSNLLTPIAVPHEPMKAAVRKALQIITKIEGDTSQIATKLVLPDKFNYRSAEEVSRLRQQLDVAAAHVDSAGRSLKLICSQEQGVLDRKAKLIDQLREMDARISILGSSLPSPPPERGPIIFDASKFSQ